MFMLAKIDRSNWGFFDGKKCFKAESRKMAGLSAGHRAQYSRKPINFATNGLGLKRKSTKWIMLQAFNKTTTLEMFPYLWQVWRLRTASPTLHQFNKKPTTDATNVLNPPTAEFLLKHLKSSRLETLPSTLQPIGKGGDIRFFIILTLTKTVIKVWILIDEHRFI